MLNRWHKHGRNMINGNERSNIIFGGGAREHGNDIRRPYLGSDAYTAHTAVPLFLLPTIAAIRFVHRKTSTGFVSKNLLIIFVKNRFEWEWHSFADYGLWWVSLSPLFHRRHGQGEQAGREVFELQLPNNKYNTPTMYIGAVNQSSPYSSNKCSVSI